VTANSFDLSGKVALISGSSGGLGAHFARLLAGAGAQVVMAAPRMEQLEEQAAGIAADGNSCTTITLDVADAPSIAAIAPILGNVDILVNNAGTVPQSIALDHTEADWDAVMDINLKGMFLLAQAAGGDCGGHSLPRKHARVLHQRRNPERRQGCRKPG
jgi:NAD(P)-dependent dehydrogenase (short-subunit alcohol dehydrogenase family)